MIRGGAEPESFARPHFPRGEADTVDARNQVIRMTGNARRSWKSLARSTRGEGMVSYGLVTGLIVALSVSGLAAMGKFLSQEFRDTTERLGGAETVMIVTPRPSYASPCGDLYASGSRTNGVFEAPASDGSPSLSMACHFETRPGLEGGWTVVASQRETAPASSWGEGIDTSRSGPGYFDTSFALSEYQLPAHGAFAVGRRLDSGAIEILDGVSASYTTGSLAYWGADYLESLEAPGVFYDIHRNVAENFCGHEPQSDHRVNGEEAIWNDTLTFNLRDDARPETTEGCGQVELTYAFSPLVVDAEKRGYAYEGYKGATVEPYSWIVLVR